MSLAKSVNGFDLGSKCSNIRLIIRMTPLIQPTHEDDGQDGRPNPNSVHGCPRSLEIIDRAVSVVWTHFAEHSNPVRIRHHRRGLSEIFPSGRIR